MVTLYIFDLWIVSNIISILAWRRVQRPLPRRTLGSGHEESVLLPDLVARLEDVVVVVVVAAVVHAYGGRATLARRPCQIGLD